MAKSKKHIHQMTAKQWEAFFPTEDVRCNSLVAHQWPEGIVCAGANDDFSGEATWGC